VIATDVARLITGPAKATLLRAQEPDGIDARRRSSGPKGGEGPDEKQGDRDMASVHGSPGSTAYSWADSGRVSAAPSGSPTASAGATGIAQSRSTRPSTCMPVVPNASLMPSSRVRCATSYDSNA